MVFVLDASVALPWCFRDEANSLTDSLLDRAIAGDHIHVPAHWPSEILNGLTRAARRGRIDRAEVDKFLSDLALFEIFVDVLPMSENWNSALPLVRKHRLSAYDAAYLGLAIRLNVELATLDDQLRQAAIAEGVPLAL